MPVIHSIVYQPAGHENREPPGEYVRVPLERASLIAGHGIEGDQKAGHHPDRQLNVLSQEWLDSLQPRGYKTGPGQFGEQMIVSGLAVENLPPGTRLQLGPKAVIEVVKPRTGCSRLEAAQEKSIQGVGGIGVLARVIVSGVVAVGDPVSVLQTAPEAAEI